MNQQRFYTMAEAMDWPMPKFIIDQWLVENGITILSGLPKVGKTSVAADLMVAVASQRAWANGLPVNKQCNVMAFLGESPSGVFAKLTAKAQLEGLNPKALPIQLQPGVPNFLDSELGLKADQVEFARGGLLVIDNLTIASAVSDTEMISWNRTLKLLGAIRAYAEKYSMSVLLIHHPNKSGGAIGGAQSIGAFCDLSHEVVLSGQSRCIKGYSSRDSVIADPIYFEIQGHEARFNKEVGQCGIVRWLDGPRANHDFDVVLKVAQHLAVNGKAEFTTKLFHELLSLPVEKQIPAGMCDKSLKHWRSLDTPVIRALLLEMERLNLLDKYKVSKVYRFKLKPVALVDSMEDSAQAH